MIAPAQEATAETIAGPQSELALRRDFVLITLVGFFLLALVVANAMAATKIVRFDIFGLTLFQAVGIIAYPITFLVTDLISELYGRKLANRTVVVGFLVSLGLVVLVEIGRALPSASPERQVVFTNFFNSTTRAVFASMLAYLIAQFIDVRLFHFWKRKTKGRHLWLRNNGSTLGSQIVDTVVVSTVLFYGTATPFHPDGHAMSMVDIWPLIKDGILFKAIVALVDTPLFYLGVYALGRYLAPSGDNPSPAAA